MAAATSPAGAEGPAAPVAGLPEDGWGILPDEEDVPDAGGSGERASRFF